MTGFLRSAAPFVQQHLLRVRGKTTGINRFLSTTKDQTRKFDFTVQRFNDVHIKSTDITKFCSEFTFSSAEDRNAAFTHALRDSLKTWRAESRSAVWLYLPIEFAGLAELASTSEFNFKYHHAENGQAVLTLWLRDTQQSKIPLFATHQMGVAGVVYREDKKQLLLVKDKAARLAKFWKLPGGAADLGENLQETAVREVFEETGIKAEFRSMIAMRQQHNYPTAHGRSDLYVICRLEPKSFEINKCHDEINVCEWVDLDLLVDYKENQITRSIAQLMAHGVEHGFQHIDIASHHMESPFKGRHYNLFHRPI